MEDVILVPPQNTARLILLCAFAALREAYFHFVWSLRENLQGKIRE